VRAALGRREAGRVPEVQAALRQGMVG
jgi:hypothetical protein